MPIDMHPIGGGANAAEVSGGAVDYPLTAAYGAVQGAGSAPLALTLAPGNYLLLATLPILADSSNSYDEIKAKFYNATAGADVAGSEEIASFLYEGTQGALRLSKRVKLTARSTIQAWAVNTAAARGTVKASGLSLLALGQNAVNGSWPLPSITSFTPAYGESASVTITGSGFTGAAAVSFGGTPAASFTVNSDTQVTATSPASFTAGAVSVTTPGGTAVSVGVFTPAQPTYDIVVEATTGIVSYWKLQETGGDLAADSVGSNPLTINSGVVPGLSGCRGLTAYEFTASCTGLLTSNLLGANGAGAFSYDMWICPSSTSGRGVLASCDSGSSGWFALLDSGNIAWQTSDHGFYPEGTSLSVGTWYHVAVTYNNGTVNMYVDGVNVCSGPNSFSSTSGASTIVGSDVSGRGFAGLMQQVAFYGVELTAAQVAAHYAAA